MCDTRSEHLKRPGRFGSAASPVLHVDCLYVVNDNATHSFMVAIDTNTGEEIWRVDRDERGQNWSTPFVWENELRTELVTSGTGGIRSYDLDGISLGDPRHVGADDSHSVCQAWSPLPQLWVSRRRVETCVCGPAWCVRATSRSGQRTGFGLVSRRFSGPKESTEYVAWSYPLLGTYNTSALVYGDYYYTLLDRGFLVCHDALTGEEVYGRQRLEIGNGFTASPWAYNGKIFLLSEDGDTYVVEAGTRVQDPSQELADEMSLATPAVVRGSLLLPTQSKLYRIAEGRRFMIVSCVLRTWTSWVLGPALIAGASAHVAAQVQLEQVGTIPGPADLVKVDGSRAFVTHHRTFKVFDVSDPAAPQQTGALTLPEEIWKFSIRGDRAYVGANFHGLSILDLSNPDAPRELGAFQSLGKQRLERCTTRKWPSSTIWKALS